MMDSALCAYEILDVLTSLCDRSLIHFDKASGRYGLLETVRQYANELLLASGEDENTERRHLAHFVNLAEQPEPRLTGAEQAEWLSRLHSEHENLRTCLDRSLRTDSADEGLRLCGALARYWWTRGYLSEGREWCERTLHGAGEDAQARDRAKALCGAGSLAHYQGDYAAARRFSLESLSMQRELGDRFGIAASLNVLGNAANAQGEHTLARAYHEESLSIRREISDQSGTAYSLNSLGILTLVQGDYAASRAFHEESLAIRREIGDRYGMGMSLHNLGTLVSAQGDYSAARAYYEESLTIRREIADQWGIGYSLNGLGNVTTNQGDYGSARAYLEEGLSILREIGDRSGLAYSLNGLGTVSRFQGDHALARTYYEQSLSIRRDIGDRHGTATSLNNLAIVANALLDHTAARAYHEECLSIRTEIADRWGLAFSLEAFAVIMFWQALPERAARLWGAAERLREEIGASLPSSFRAEYERNVEAAREALGEDAFSVAWQAGREMSWEQAAKYSLEADQK